MGDKKIQPKRPEGEQAAAGIRDAEKTSARRFSARRWSARRWSARRWSAKRV